MKIGVLGGGITGLTAAYELAEKGHEVVLMEKGTTLGGLARGFKQKNWKWPLEYAYHHLFASDADIINFAQKIGYKGIYFKIPKTESLYGTQNNYRIIPVDSPQDFLKFPLLTMPEKIRAAAVLAVLKFLPFFPYYETITSEKFVKTYMGDRMWKTFFEQLFLKKYGRSASKVSAAFLWARINKRTQSLGYMKGGFQSFIDHLEKSCQKLHVDIRTGYEIGTVKKTATGFSIQGEKFDRLVTTLPSAIMLKVFGKQFPSSYVRRLGKLRYLHARVLILETDKPILEKTYWLNICTPEVPAMVFAQHTNFADKKNYGGHHIAYIGYYLEEGDKKLSMTDKELVKMLKPYLKEIEKSDWKILKSYVFTGPFAQPIFDRAFAKNKPDFITPVEGLFCANLDMTYPYDRGTNYAVSLGRRVAEIIR